MVHVEASASPSALSETKLHHYLPHEANESLGGMRKGPSLIEIQKLMKKEHIEAKNEKIMQIGREKSSSTFLCLTALLPPSTQPDRVHHKTTAAGVS